MKKKFINPLKSIVKNLPIMFAIILLLGIVKEFITFNKISNLFTNNTLIDTVIGALTGSIFAGNSMNSYIIARELETAGVSMYAITSFLVSWVTVGLLHMPVEAQILGKSFAVKRNLISAGLAIFVSLITVSLWRVL